MVGPVVFSTLVGEAWEQKLCQKFLQIFGQAPKSLWEKLLIDSESKIFIKGL